MTHIFLDVDGCLLDNKYQPTTDPNKVSNIIAHNPDLTVHLNSNRSLDQLMSVYNQFGLNGNIIVENGCAVWDVSNEKFIQLENMKLFDRERLPEVKYQDTDVIVKKTTKTCIKFDDMSIYGEMKRKFTMTLYPRKTQLDIQYVSEKMLNECSKIAREAYPDYDITTDTEIYSNILLKPKGIEKSTPMEEIIKGKRSFAFGDTIDDIPMSKIVDGFGFPENASLEVYQSQKENKNFNKFKPYTQGVVEFLESVVDENSNIWKSCNR